MLIYTLLHYNQGDNREMVHSLDATWQNAFPYLKYLLFEAVKDDFNTVMQYFVAKISKKYPYTHNFKYKIEIYLFTHFVACGISLYRNYWYFHSNLQQCKVFSFLMSASIFYLHLCTLLIQHSFSESETRRSAQMLYLSC